MAKSSKPKPGAVPPPAIGDNSGIAAARLRSFIERVQRLHTERDNLASDIREVYAEAKGNGFCTKTMKLVLQRMAKETPDLIEQDELLDLYLRAMGLPSPVRKETVFVDRANETTPAPAPTPAPAREGADFLEAEAGQ